MVFHCLSLLNCSTYRIKVLNVLTSVAPPMKKSPKLEQQVWALKFSSSTSSLNRNLLTDLQQRRLGFLGSLWPLQTVKIASFSVLCNCMLLRQHMDEVLHCCCACSTLHIEENMHKLKFVNLELALSNRLIKLMTTSFRIHHSQITLASQLLSAATVESTSEIQPRQQHHLIMGLAQNLSFLRIQVGTSFCRWRCREIQTLT